MSHVPLVKFPDRYPSTYRVTFKRGHPRTIELHDIVAVDYYGGHLYFSDGNLTYTYHVDEIETSERVAS